MFQKYINAITHFSLHAQIKINGRVISPALTFIVLLYGLCCVFRSLFRRVGVPLLYPILRRLFRRLVRRKSKLLSPQPEVKWVLIYGACTKVGKLTARLLASHNYSLILVDQSLSKLQKLQAEVATIFPGLNESRIKIVQIDFSTQRDSTAIEHQLHRAFFERDPWEKLPPDPRTEVEAQPETTDHGNRPILCKQSSLKEHVERHSLSVPNVEVFVNCAGLMQEAKTMQVKLFHEVQFDQIFSYLGNTMLGFSILLNYFTRVHVHHQNSACVITFANRVLLPWERDGNPLLLRIGAMLVRPLTYHRNMERVDLFTLAQNAYTKELLQASNLHYPLLKSHIIHIDSRDIPSLKSNDVERYLYRLNY